MSKWKPELDERYYIPCVCTGKGNFRWCRWINDELDYSRYEAGIICESKEEAIEMAKKMLLVAKDNTNETLKEHIKAISRYCRSRADCDECCLTTLNGYYCFPNWKSPDHWEKDIDSVLKEHEQ